MEHEISCPLSQQNLESANKVLKIELGKDHMTCFTTKFLTWKTAKLSFPEKHLLISTEQDEFCRLARPLQRD